MQTDRRNYDGATGNHGDTRTSPLVSIVWNYLHAMNRISLSLSIMLCLTLMGCYSNDQRLPEKLYSDALELSQQGMFQESKALMEEIASRFSEKLVGMSAGYDVWRLERVIESANEEENRQVRVLIRSTIDALARYRNRFGEYPTTLMELIPDYGLAQIPVTPCGHPLFYRPYVNNPRERVSNRRGGTTTRDNTRFDSYQLAYLGKDLKPGAPDKILVLNGQVIYTMYFPKIPSPQPLR